MIEQPASRLTVVCRFIYQTDIPLIGGKIRKLGKSTILVAWLEHNIDIFLCTPVHCIFLLMITCNNRGVIWKMLHVFCARNVTQQLKKSLCHVFGIGINVFPNLLDLFVYLFLLNIECLSLFLIDFLCTVPHITQLFSLAKWLNNYLISSCITGEVAQCG